MSALPNTAAWFEHPQTRPNVPPIDVVETALLEHGCRPERRGDAITAHCPTHDDNQASLSVSAGADGKALLKCQAGCETRDVVAALGLEWSDLFSSPPERTNDREIVAAYSYADENGTLLYQSVRYSPKDFRQRRPDGGGGWIWKLKGTRRVPYQLRDVLGAGNRVIYIVEGEKDVDRLRSLGLVATCNAGGAGKCLTDWGERYFTHAKVAILPDNDDPGRQHAEQVAQSLHSHAAEIRVVELPDLAPKGDVSDWLNAGHTIEELHALVKAAPSWTPDRPRVNEGSESVADEYTGPRLIGVPASTITPSRPEWLCTLWVLKGAVNLLTARQGTGKTTFAAHVVSLCTRGLALPGDVQRPPIRAAFLSLEEPKDRLVARLSAASADLDRVVVLCTVEDVDADGRPFHRPWRMPDDVSILGKAIDQHDVQLVVVDGLGYAIKGDSHNYATVGSALSALAGEAERTGAAILGLVHPPKGKSIDPVTAAIGSTAWTAIPRLSMVMHYDPTDQSESEADKLRVVAVGKSNYKLPESAFAFNIGEDRTYECGAVVGLHPSSVTAAALMAGPPDDDERSERDHAREFVAEFVSDGPVEAREAKRLAKDAGITDRTLDRARRAEGITTRREGFGKGRFRVLRG